MRKTLHSLEPKGTEQVITNTDTSSLQPQRTDDGSNDKSTLIHDSDRPIHDTLEKIKSLVQDIDSINSRHPNTTTSPAPLLSDSQRNALLNATSIISDGVATVTKSINKTLSPEVKDAIVQASGTLATVYGLLESNTDSFLVENKDTINRVANTVIDTVKGPLGESVSDFVSTTTQKALEKAKNEVTERLQDQLGAEETQKLLRAAGDLATILNTTVKQTRDYVHDHQDVIADAVKTGGAVVKTGFEAVQSGIEQGLGETNNVAKQLHDELKADLEQKYQEHGKEKHDIKENIENLLINVTGLAAKNYEKVKRGYEYAKEGLAGDINLEQQLEQEQLHAQDLARKNIEKIKNSVGNIVEKGQRKREEYKYQDDHQPAYQEPRQQPPPTSVYSGVDVQQSYTPDIKYREVNRTGDQADSASSASTAMKKLFSSITNIFHRGERHDEQQQQQEPRQQEPRQDRGFSQTPRQMIPVNHQQIGQNIGTNNTTDNQSIFTKSNMDGNSVTDTTTVNRDGTSSLHVGGHPNDITLSNGFEKQIEALKREKGVDKLTLDELCSIKVPGTVTPVLNLMTETAAEHYLQRELGPSIDPTSFRAKGEEFVDRVSDFIQNTGGVIPFIKAKPYDKIEDLRERAYLEKRFENYDENDIQNIKRNPSSSSSSSSSSPPSSSPITTSARPTFPSNSSFAPTISPEARANVQHWYSAGEKYRNGEFPINPNLKTQAHSMIDRSSLVPATTTATPSVTAAQIEQRDATPLKTTKVDAKIEDGSRVGRFSEWLSKMNIFADLEDSDTLYSPRQPRQAPKQLEKQKQSPQSPQPRQRQDYSTAFGTIMNDKQQIAASAYDTPPPQHPALSRRGKLTETMNRLAQMEDQHTLVKKTQRSPGYSDVHGTYSQYMPPRELTRRELGSFFDEFGEFTPWNGNDMSKFNFKTNKSSMPLTPIPGSAELAQWLDIYGTKKDKPIPDEHRLSSETVQNIVESALFGVPERTSSGKSSHASRITTDTTPVATVSTTSTAPTASAPTALPNTIHPHYPHYTETSLYHTPVKKYPHYTDMQAYQAVDNTAHQYENFANSWKQDLEQQKQQQQRYIDHTKHKKHTTTTNANTNTNVSTSTSTSTTKEKEGVLQSIGHAISNVFKRDQHLQDISKEKEIIKAQQGVSSPSSTDLANHYLSSHTAGPNFDNYVSTVKQVDHRNSINMPIFERFRTSMPVAMTASAVDTADSSSRNSATFTANSNSSSPQTHHLSQTHHSMNSALDHVGAPNSDSGLYAVPGSDVLKRISHEIHHQLSNTGYCTNTEYHHVAPKPKKTGLFSTSVETPEPKPVQTPTISKSTKAAIPKAEGGKLVTPLKHHSSTSTPNSVLNSGSSQFISHIAPDSINVASAGDKYQGQNYEQGRYRYTYPHPSHLQHTHHDNQRNNQLYPSHENNTTLSPFLVSGRPYIHEATSESVENPHYWRSYIRDVVKSVNRNLKKECDQESLNRSRDRNRNNMITDITLFPVQIAASSVDTQGQVNPASSNSATDITAPVAIREVFIITREPALNNQEPGNIIETIRPLVFADRTYDHAYEKRKDEYLNKQKQLYQPSHMQANEHSQQNQQYQRDSRAQTQGDDKNYAYRPLVVASAVETSPMYLTQPMQSPYSTSTSEKYGYPMFDSDSSDGETIRNAAREHEIEDITDIDDLDNPYQNKEQSNDQQDTDEEDFSRSYEEMFLLGTETLN